MSPLEAVSRAICFQFYGTDWGRTSEFRQEICTGIARAALTALRDNGVTAKMFLAWNDAHGPADEFRAMLDAALEGN